MGDGVSSKKLIRDLFGHKAIEKIPFIPWICSFAGQLEQIQTDEMFSDAGSLSRSLINAQKLFGYDAIASVFDASLEAEACGCEIDWGEGRTLPVVVSHPLGEGTTIESLDIPNFEKRGRIPVVLEATKRIKAIKGKDVAIVGVVTGPLTLARHLRGDAFIADLNQGGEEATKLIAATGNIALKLCRAYCELGIDVVAVADEVLGQIQPDLIPLVSAPLRSIWNVARFYDARSLVISKGCSQEHIEPILGLQADGVALSGQIDYARLSEAAEKRGSCYARVIPDSALLAPVPQTESTPASLFQPCGKGVFLSTEWEVPYTANVNSMHDIMHTNRG